MTAIIHNLAHGPLSTLELCNDSATVEFWEALARCTALHTLILKNLRISGNVFPAFWRASFRFESLFLYNTMVNADDNHAPQHWYGARSRRLKHIVLEQNSVLRQSDLASLPWYCAPYLETERCSSGSVSRADMQALQLKIWRASIAARKGCVFYGAGTGDQSELLFLDQEDDEHLMGAEPCCDIEQLRGLIPGRKIREFQCVLPPLNCEFCLVPIIRNMDALEKFSVGPLRHARHELAPLQQHVDTLVELDLWHCNLAEATLVRFLEQCPRLQVFVANRIQAEAVVKSRPWVCTGMRQLRVPLQSTPMSQLHSPVPGLDEEHEQLLERLAGLPCLERFYMPKYWYRCGLDRLRGLAHVQDVYFTATSIISLEEVDARWMVEHWPALKTVRMPAHNIEHNLSLGAGRVFEDHGVECLQLVDGQCP